MVFQSLLSEGSGSVLNTSRAAPPSFPFSRLSQRASSSIAEPLPTFTTKAPLGSNAMRSRFNMSLVSGVSGRLITRRSADGSSKSSSDTFFTASNAGSSHLPLLDTPIMHSGSNALALLAKSNSEIEACKKQIAELNRQIDNQRLTSAFSSAEGNPEAKQRLTKLIAEIDKCIDLLEA